jgi:hypothetical protein
VRIRNRPGDTGEADPAVAAALAAYADGTGSEHEVLTVLARSRLLVPVVAQATAANDDGTEKETEMALPTLVGKDGRAAVIAFTGTDTVRRWNAAARPVPYPAARVWEYAKHEASAAVIDIAGPVPVVVEGARLAALAAGQAPPRAHEDPDVHAQIAAVTSEFTLEPGPPGTDFMVTLRMRDTAAAQAAAQEIGGRVRAAGRFRRGIGIRISP